MSREGLSTEAIRHYYRGRVFEATGELDIAIEEYKKAIELGADYADIHNSLGRALAKKGFFEEARIEFEKALRLNPRYLEAQRNLNELLTKLSLRKEYKELTPVVSATAPAPPPLQPTVSVTAQQPEEPEQKLYYEKLYKQKIIKSVLLYVGVIIVIIPLSILCYKNFVRQQKVPIQKVYTTKLETISSINKFDNKLVLSSWLSQEIVFYKIDKENLSMLSSYKVDKENIVPTSVCLIDETLYVLDAWNKKVYKYLMVNSKPTVIKVLDISDTEPLTIAVYKNYILIFDNKSSQIIVYTKELNKIVETVPYFVKDIIYVSSYKNELWMLDSNYVLYQLKGYKEIKQSFKLSFVIGKQISAFFVDNKFIWFATEGAPYLYCYSRSIIE
jgi:tetratricopeptide (TPR) repeat protein